MKKILIISYLFSPKNSVGAVRPTKLAKYLNKLGYSVDVISADLNLFYKDDSKSELNFLDNLWVISEDNKPIPYRKIVLNQEYVNRPEKKHKLNLKVDTIKRKVDNNFILMMKNLYRTLRLLKKSVTFTKNFEKFISHNNFDGNDYDAVISTFGPIHSVFCGNIFKNIFPEVPWICDFRDPMVVEQISPFLKPYYQYLQRKFNKKADIVTTVSNGYLKRISSGDHQEKFKVITNGFDMDDNLSVETIKDDHRFSFTYVGSLYEGKRDLTPIFKVIRELADERVINLSNVCFNYAGNDIDFLTMQAERYNLSNIIKNHGMISRKKSLELQFSSMFLVLSTWNTNKEIGVFPGKFLEYMLISKPIIAIIDGNLPNSEVKLVMDQANLGVSYESVKKDVDYLNLKVYVKNQYERYIRGFKIDFKPNKEVVDRYNWSSIVKQFEEIINLTKVK